MRYEELKKIKKSLSGFTICLFGAGMIGCTWAYNLLKAMGFHIDFYCDNNKKEGLVIKKGIKIISPEKLYSLGNRVCVFVTISSKYQEEIINQLQINKIHNIVRVDASFLQIFIESLIELNDSYLNEQFKCILDDKEYLSEQFNYVFGYQLNLKEPRTLNEKIQWLKLYDRNPEYTKLVDKYEIKKYVACKVGEEYIIPTLGVYDIFEQINFEVLPQQFVMKCTHDSGSIVICRNKDEFDRNKAKIFFEKALKRNFYWASREWPYKNVKPRIIIEKYMSDESNDELKDYKIFNFNGKAKLIQVDYDRFKAHKRNLYTVNWEYIDATIKYPNDPKRKIKCPERLKEMIALSETLSKGIPFVRIDLYSIKENIYFGEMTFYHGGGYEKFKPAELECRLGGMLQI